MKANDIHQQVLDRHQPAGDGYISILPGTGAEMLAPVPPREENTPGAACGWGAHVHTLAGLAGIFSSEVIFHFVRGGRRKGWRPNTEGFNTTIEGVNYSVCHDKSLAVLS